MGLQPDNKITDFGYYEKETSQIEVEFGGNLSKLLNIEGTHDREAAFRLFRGMKPELVDGEEQKLVTRLDKSRIGAWDWTFNVDKSVSMAELVAGDTRIGDVRTKAETAALEYIQSQCRVKVRKASEMAKMEAEGKPKVWKLPVRYTDNLLWDGHRHVINRDGACHGHTHYRIYNLSFDKEEGIVKAIDLRYVDRKGANDIYRKVLRKGLNELGYKTRTVGKEFEIVGFPAEVKAIFSQRHESIKEMERGYEAKAGKPMGSKAKGKLSVYNRPEKPTDMPLPERRKGWLSRLTAGQVRSVAGVVSRAKDAVKNRGIGARLSRWHTDISRHASQLRMSVLMQETEVPERSRSDGRSR